VHGVEMEAAQREWSITMPRLCLLIPCARGALLATCLETTALETTLSRKVNFASRVQAPSGLGRIMILAFRGKLSAMNAKSISGAKVPTNVMKTGKASRALSARMASMPLATSVNAAQTHRGG
jgi:hypothetical protein